MVEDRRCTLGEFDEVENECHFLSKCSLHYGLKMNG